MNKYKIISIVLTVALLATMARLLTVTHNQTEASSSGTTAQVVMANILQRKSVRSYTNAPVSREQIDTLLRAAMAAPTGKDMRPWKFVVVNDPEAMGLGAVWTGVYPYDERLEAVKRALNLPDHIIPLALIPVGHPKGDPQPKDKYDAANIHFNQW